MLCFSLENFLSIDNINVLNQSAKLKPGQIKDLEGEPDLMSKSNNGALKDAINIAKKIVDGDTTYEGTYCILK
jgi:hypothetical protein